MKTLSRNKKDLVSYSIRFHDYITKLSQSLIYSIIPYKMDVPLEEAQSNMEQFANKLSRGEKVTNESLEDKLKTLGGSYIPKDEIAGLQSKILWKSALKYDFKGIVPIPNENLRDFVYRANTLLFIHRQIRTSGRVPEIEAKDQKVDLSLRHGVFVKQEDLDEANERIPYDMDLSWFSAIIKDKSALMVPALGLTFTLPQFNGFNFINMRSEYKSREQFISVLAHEMTHAGTVYFDKKRDFLETKAYSVGKGDLMLGEYVVALNASPRFLLGCIKWILERFTPFAIPEKYYKILPKIRSGIEILINTKAYRDVQKELIEIYGNKGNYILGRLNSDEMEEFRDTNNIPGRIKMKKDLKWKIIKTNFEKLE